VANRSFWPVRSANGKCDETEGSSKATVDAGAYAAWLWGADILAAMTSEIMATMQHYRPHSVFI